MVAVFYLFTSLLVCIEATVLMIRENDEFCIWVQAKRGETIGHNFAVFKKTPLDVVNLRISGPDDQDVIILSDVEGDQLSFKAEVEGKYTICYDNTGSDVITVAFRNLVGEAAIIKESLMKDSGVGSIDTEVQRLVQNSIPVWDELDNYRRRVEFHAFLAETQLKSQSTFIIGKLLMILATSLILVYFISSIFETKRKL